MFRKLIFMSLIFTASSAQAGQVWTGTIRTLSIGNVGAADLAGGATVDMNPGVTLTGSSPSCSRNNQVMTFDSTTANGRSLVKMFLAAKLTNAIVLVRGSGTCSYTGVYEDVSSVNFL